MRMLNLDNQATHVLFFPSEQIYEYRNLNFKEDELEFSTHLFSELML